LKSAEADLKKQRGAATAEVAKATAAARDKRGKITRSTSQSTINSNLREAERQDKRAVDYEKKAADLSKKIADNIKRQTEKERSLDSALRDEQRQRDRYDERRRRTERDHAREVGRLSRQTVHHVHETRVVEPPKPERLRVLYLSANPEMDLRLDAEVRMVRDSVRKALLRDLVDIDHRPAATPEDLLDGLNEYRPHVVHFSGHSGDGFTLFDNGSVDEPEGRDVSIDLLRRALAATDTPPVALVLNSCDSLDGADVVLDVVPVVIGMASSISDLGAATFAARFYAAVASAQSVEAAVKQGAVGVDLAVLDDDEGWMPDVLVRDDIDLSELVLVRVPGGSD
jgi:hypothetical protein